jgi:iron-sulfur cluster assembly protein
MYLLGTEMDFVVEEFKSGFTFTNPNEKGKCGCGSSFNV